MLFLKSSPYTLRSKTGRESLLQFSFARITLNKVLAVSASDTTVVPITALNFLGKNLNKDCG